MSHHVYPIIVEARSAAGLSQAELARRAGIPRSVMNVYERGKRVPSAEMFVRLMNAAGFRIAPVPVVPPTDPVRAGRILEQVLGLAEALPLLAEAGQLISAAGKHDQGRSMTELVEKLHAIHDALTKAGLRHAFGGAIALAYCIAEPRGTRDLDVNVFVPADRAGEVAEALPTEVKIDETDIQKILRDGQTRVMWDDIPVDLFLNNLPVHDEIAGEIRWVPLAGREIPVLSCESLVFFKAFFNRTKDWADIEAVGEVDRSILSRAADRVESLIGDDAEFAQRLRRVAASGDAMDR